MLSDTELEKVCAKVCHTLSNLATVADVVDNILNDCTGCPICKELFLSSNELREHLEKIHLDQLQSSGSKQVTGHGVEEGDSKIYLCPHCYFAIGEDSQIRASTDIYNHVQECQWNLSRRSGPACVSFRISDDDELINAYIRNQLKIALFPCSHCTESFGSRKTLIEHLIQDHSSVCAQDLTDDQLSPIRRAAQSSLERPSVPYNLTTHRKRAVPLRMPQIAAKPDDQRPVYAPIHRSSELIGQEFSRTVNQKEIDEGFIVLPLRLSSCLSGVNRVTVHIASDMESTVLPFDPHEGRLKNLTEWFRKSAIEAGDKIKFRLLSVDPPEIRIWTEWEKHLNYVLRCPVEDFKWEHLPLRDCLIRFFADHRDSIHYRSLYSQISKHRNVAIGSVLAALSKYRGLLFVHVGRGMWSRLQDHVDTDASQLPQARLPHDEHARSSEVISDTIWKIVAEIEKDDIVYLLLKRTREPLSFTQICQKIAEAWRIDWHELQYTGFLNAEDERLKRLDNGHFALREWFDDPALSTTMQPQPAIDSNPVEKAPVVLPTDNADESSPPVRVSVKVSQRLLSRFRTVARRVLGFLVRWVQRRSHD